MKKNKIKIKPSKKGTFKAQASKMGMGVQEAASKILNAPEDKYSPEMRKKANFAKNFAKENGGELPMYNFGGFNFMSMLGNMGGQGSNLNPAQSIGLNPTSGNMDWNSVFNTSNPTYSTPPMSQQPYNINVDPNQGVPNVTAPEVVPMNKQKNTFWKDLGQGLQNQAKNQSVNIPSFNSPINNYYFNKGAQHFNKGVEKGVEGVKTWFGMGENGKYIMANGGQNPPIYTTNPNDPRLLAYQDSLDAFKLSQKFLNNPAFEQAALINPPVDKQGFYYKEVVNRYKGNNPTGYLAQKGDNYAEYPIYQKPVQPVIHRPSEYIVPEKYKDHRLGENTELGNDFHGLQYKKSVQPIILQKDLTPEVELLKMEADKPDLLQPNLQPLEFSTVPFKKGTYFTREPQSQEMGQKEYFDKKTGKKLMKNGGKLKKAQFGMNQAEAIVDWANSAANFTLAGINNTKGVLDMFGNFNTSRNAIQDEAQKARIFNFQNYENLPPTESFGYGMSGRNPAFAEFGAIIKNDLTIDAPELGGYFKKKKK